MKLTILVRLGLCTIALTAGCAATTTLPPYHTIWIRQMGTPLVEDRVDFARAISVDKESSSYVVGATNGSLGGNENSGNFDLFLVKFNADGTRLWTKQIGLTEFDEARDVTIGPSGNIYITGLTGPAGFYNRGVRIENLGEGDYDVFVMKFDPGGEALWTRRVGTSEFDSGMSIATDASGNVYVTGFTGGDLHGNLNAGDLDVFLMKFDSRGTQLWTRQFGSRETDGAHGVAVAPTGAVYIAGRMGWSTGAEASGGAFDYFVAKFDNDGRPLWIKQEGGILRQAALDVAVDATGNAYIAGTRATRGMVAKFDPNGVRLWKKNDGPQIGEVAQYTEVDSIALDAESNVYVVGFIDRGTMYWGPPSGARLVKFDSDGRRLWEAKLTTDESDVSDFAEGVAVDWLGNVYVTGHTVFQPWQRGGSLGELVDSYEGEHRSLDVFLAKFAEVSEVEQ